MFNIITNVVSVFLLIALLHVMILTFIQDSAEIPKDITIEKETIKSEPSPPPKKAPEPKEKIIQDNDEHANDLYNFVFNDDYDFNDTIVNPLSNLKKIETNVERNFDIADSRGVHSVNSLSATPYNNTESFDSILPFQESCSYAPI